MQSLSSQENSIELNGQMEQIEHVEEIDSIIENLGSSHDLMENTDAVLYKESTMRPLHLNNVGEQMAEAVLEEKKDSY